MPYAKRRRGTTQTIRLNVTGGGGSGYRRRAKPRTTRAYRRFRTYNRNAARKFRQDPTYRGHSWFAVPRSDATLAAYGPTWQYSTDAQRAARVQNNFYGRGSYLKSLGIRGNVGDWAKKAWRNKNVRSAARDAAMMGGDMLLPGVGGAAAGHVFDTVAGNGMYTGGHVEGRGEYNNLIDGGPPPTQLMGLSTEHGNLIVTNTEKVCDIYGNGFVSGTDQVKPFQTFTMDINPGNFLTFPELSQEAQNWKEYEMIQCIFIFESTIPDTYTTTDTQFGRVLMATQHDPNGRMAATADQMEANENVTIGSVSSSGDKISYHGVECDPEKLAVSKALKYVRTRQEKDTADYDLGRFQFGVFGTGAQFANEIIGTLKVYYKVCLKTTRLHSYFGYGIPEAQYSSTVALPATVNNRPNEDAGQGGITCAQIKSMWTNFDKTADIMAFNNIPVQIRAPLETDGWKTRYAGINPYEWGSDNNLYGNWDFAMTRQNSGEGLNYKATSLVMAPAVVVFPTNLRGDYEVSFRIEGSYLPPYCCDTQRSNGGAVDPSHRGIIPHVPSTVGYDLGQVGVLRDLPNYVFKPQALGNVTFNKDILTALPETNVVTLPAPTTYNELGAMADIEDVGGQAGSTPWSSWSDPLQPETDAYKGYEGHNTGGNSQQGYYSVVMSPTHIDVTVHVHLGVAIGSQGDNRLLVFVPVTMTEALYYPSGGSDTTPDAFNLERRVAENVTQVKQRSVTIRQYNSQARIGNEGKPYLDTRGLSAVQYDPLADVDFN